MNFSQRVIELTERLAIDSIKADLKTEEDLKMVLAHRIDELKKMLIYLPLNIDQTDKVMARRDFLIKEAKKLK